MKPIFSPSKGSSMNRERTILLRILTAVLYLPVLLLIIMTIGDIRGNLVQLDQFDNNLEFGETDPDKILALTIRRSSLEDEYNLRIDEYFSQEDISYYQFVDFIIASARNREVELEDYQTNETSVPPVLSLRGRGKIGDILNYLHFIDTFEKKIFFTEISLSRHGGGREYIISFSVNYISKESVIKEPADAL